MDFFEIILDRWAEDEDRLGEYENACVVRVPPFQPEKAALHRCGRRSQPPH